MDLNFILRTRKVEFEPDGGYRMTLGQRSILAQMLVQSQAGVSFDAMDRRSLHDHTAKFLAAIGDWRWEGATDDGEDPPFAFQPFDGVLEKRFTEVEHADDFARGRIRLSSLGYYRRQEAEHARDHFEGFLSVFFGHEDHDAMIGIKLATDHKLLCSSEAGTTSADQYGEHLVRIHQPRQFGAMLADRAKARTWELGRVTYRSRRMFESRLLGPALRPGPGGEFSLPDAFFPIFDELYDECMIPAIFQKDRSFALDQEIRFAFEVDHSPEPHEFIEAPELGRFIERVE